jgi:hypothetical protein
VAAGVAHNRKPSDILGLLCRHHFPGVVTLASTPEPAWTFEHYSCTPDQTDMLGRNFTNKTLRVIQEMRVRLPRTSLLNTSHSLVLLYIMTVYIMCTCMISIEWSPDMSKEPSAVWRPAAPAHSTSKHRAALCLHSIPPLARSLPSSFLWRTERKKPPATARHHLRRRVPTPAKHLHPIAHAQCSATFPSPPNGFLWLLARVGKAQLRGSHPRRRGWSRRAHALTTGALTLPLFFQGASLRSP